MLKPETSDGRHGNKLNAYTGIDIQRHQSATLLSKDKINRRDNRHLWKILYYMIENMIRIQWYVDKHLVDYYQKLKKQPHGKHHKVACIACVKKFLKCLFHLVTTGQRYDYAVATYHCVNW
ncbi:transposase [Salinicoccus sp. RF5]|uniref:transposase n=1 Tax=Salinicoccus sp. RF5 TaxID=2748874 RepID=UPI001E3E3EF3|nr:transposase [Salinicoccus sp. RF5]MCC4723512.1 transposase [Salinicoccus sp. RF5]